MEPGVERQPVPDLSKVSGHLSLPGYPNEAQAVPSLRIQTSAAKVQLKARPGKKVRFPEHRKCQGFLEKLRWYSRQMSLAGGLPQWRPMRCTRRRNAKRLRYAIWCGVLEAGADIAKAGVMDIAKAEAKDAAGDGGDSR